MRNEREFEKKHGKTAVTELIKAKAYLSCCCDVCQRLRENQFHVVDDIVSTVLHLLFGPGCLSLEDAMQIVRTKGVYLAESCQPLPKCSNDQERKEEIRSDEEGTNPADTGEHKAA